MAAAHIGRYKIIEQLGQGSMGRVYRARNPALNRDVVVKLVTLTDPTYSQSWFQRFKREVQASGRLNHPHIVTIYDVSLEHDPPYVVMELLSGGTLRDRLQSGPLPWSEIVAIFQALLQAIAYAHRAGVVHRDIKPNNIMFTQDPLLPPSQAGQGQRGLKLVDFGLARHLDDDLQLTQAGAVFGTPAYMSPEQARGETADARTDIFALGIILFETILGYNPLNKNSLFATLAATTSSDPIDLTPLNGKAPPEITGLIRRAVAKERHERYPTGEALLADFMKQIVQIPRLESLQEQPSLGQAQFDTRFLPRPPAEGPTISRARDVTLTPEIEGVLQIMFNQYSRLAIEAKFGQGLSGGHVFRVRPVEPNGKARLPIVVKIAPLHLIRQEWQAYQTWVVNTLPGVARLESVPTLPPGSLWDGLRYTLVGGGAFEVQSLASYYRQASPDDLRWVLTERLYQMVGVHWWLERQVDRTFQMQADYDAILPINLLIEPLPSSAANAYLITPEHLPLSTIRPGDTVHLAGFVIIEIDWAGRQITLNLPAPAQKRISSAYRLRLSDVPNLDRYQVGQIIDSLTGVVKTTRHEMLLEVAGQILGPSFDLSAELLPTPAIRNMKLPSALPNPLLAYQDMLHVFITVNIATIHGDLNLENILIDPDTRHLNLIDFATVRQGHVMHDLLRLETEVVTKIIPAILVEEDLSPLIVYSLYRQLYQATTQPQLYEEHKKLPAGLQKPLIMLASIRKMAHTCLFNPEDWTEYYQGLSIYLLGALKFKNLDQASSAPLPKQSAFWGAASLIELLQNPPEPAVINRPRIRLPLLVVAIVEALVIMALALIIGIGPFARSVSSVTNPITPTTGAHLATIIDVGQAVDIERAGTRRLVEADLGTFLHQGDMIFTRPEGMVTLICSNGLLLSLGEQRNMEINCRRETTAARVIDQLDYSLGPKLIGQSQQIPPLLWPDEPQTRTNWEATPHLLTPRNSMMANSRPTFRWETVTEASRYRLTLELADGRRWQRESSESSLPYPNDEAPLAPGGVNTVQLVAFAGQIELASDQTELRLIVGDDLTALFEAQTQINNLELNEATRRFLLAQLYRDQALWTDAIAELEALIDLQPAPSAGLRQQLGNLYLKVGLYLAAEDSYRQALTAVDPGQKPQLAAAIQTGLAQVALAFGQTDQAATFLAEAETLYREAGLTDAAESITAERERLE